MKTLKMNSESEKGFTLVELAIVMIIIGLLIGGILKGQQLIANAEISSTVTLLKSVDTGMNTFRDAYAAIPGDMTNPVARIQNCAGACARVGSGNGRIDGLPGAAQATLANENGAAWAQMSAADVMGGVNSSNAVATATGATNSLPAASVGGSLQIGYNPTGALTADTAAANAAGGHYVVLDISNAAVSSAATAGLTQAQAARIDRKMDDGLPNTGSVRAMGAASATGCTDDGTVTGIYNEALNTTTCGLYSRVQG